MNLQGHAGSRAQLGHHVLQEPSGVKTHNSTHLVLLFWSETVYLYYYIIFINIGLPDKFRKYVSIIWFQILVALILLMLAAVGEYYQVSKNTPVTARLIWTMRIVSFLLPRMHHKAETKDISLTKQQYLTPLAPLLHNVSYQLLSVHFTQTNDVNN